ILPLPDKGNIRISLKQNFRSRESVLHAINEVFFRIMSFGLGGVAYDEDAALYPGRDFEEARRGGKSSAKMPELLLCSCDDPDKEESRQETEARLVAKRIRELMSEEGGLLIEDPKAGGFRALRYSDIVILFRAMAGWAECFVDILTEEGIPAYAQTSSGYFDTAEIRLILALLAVIDNPYQDIEFAAFLHAPFVGINEEEMAQMLSFYRKNRAEEKKHIHLCEVCMQLADSEEAKRVLCPSLLVKLKNALELLEIYRKRSKQMRLGELLRGIYHETGYLDYVSALQAGEIRRANLMMLLDKATEYADTGYSGLFHFILYIDKLRKLNTDYGEAAVLGETDDTVRIMSIHKSKGLEFPVCIIGGMGKQFNMTDLRSPIILDEELGIGCDYVDSEKRIKWSSIKKNTIRHRKRSEALGEELRVLYVGMSRAKEKLIMSAAVKDANETLEKYLQVESKEKEALPSSYVRAANSYLDWLLLCREGIEKVMDIRVCGQSDLLARERENQGEALLFEEAFENLEPIEDEDLKRIIAKPYAYMADTELYTKMSVSELKSLEPREEEEALLPELEDLLGISHEESAGDCREEKEKGGKKEERKRTGRQDRSARGRAYHKVLELMNYAAVKSGKDLEGFLSRLVKEDKLSKEERSLVCTKDLLGWINSDLGAKFREAEEEGRLERELRFIMGVPADELGLAESKESILVQGIIDAYIEYEDFVILIDYKTDRVKNAQELRLRYTKQLEYYEKALQRILKKPVRAKYIWSFALHDTITC
ncbi:MAG: 3'-5' exonuclease, partial [Johnsonella sp.]|nr:3'-5' exonuclease [Johnsonella sp.]